MLARTSTWPSHARVGSFTDGASSDVVRGIGESDAAPQPANVNEASSHIMRVMPSDPGLASVQVPSGRSEHRAAVKKQNAADACRWRSQDSDLCAPSRGLTRPSCDLHDTAHRRS
jgi:hypothetical protein